MKKITVLFCLLFPLLVIAQRDSVLSGVRDWKEPAEKSTYGSSSVLFEGQTNTMEWLQVNANIMQPSGQKKRNRRLIPDNEEQLIIIKSGMMSVSIRDSSFTVGAGSVVLLLPKENYDLLSGNQAPCSYYTIRYRSKLPVDTASGKAAGRSVVKDWNETEFKPGEKGGRRNFFERPTAMCKRLEIHVTTLKEGLKSHAPHTHTSAEFTLIKEGKTEMLIGDKLYSGSEGSVYYAPSNVLHALENKGSCNCTYFAIQFE